MADQTGLSTKLSDFVTAFRNLITRYEDAVVKDPSLATRVETGLKLISYMMPGRLGITKDLSEFAYCISNLFTLLNDFIIASRCPSASSVNKLSSHHRYLLWSISVIECIEVVLELIGEYFWREPGKWMTIIISRIIKATLQCIVIFTYKSQLLNSPAVPTIDRTKVRPVPSDITLPPDGKSVAYRGTRTGTVIRSIHSDPGIPYSELPYFMSLGSSDEEQNDKRGGVKHLVIRTLLAELLHISRPLVHIFSMMVFQQSSWKPWLISLLMDVISLHLHGGLLKYKKNSESSEILRRRVVLLLFLLRSPFYDQYTKNTLMSFLKYLSQHLPLVHWILDPIAEYLPIWQQIYSYCWMS